MGGSSSHWVVVALVIAILMWATGRIAGRLGYSSFWALLLFVPCVNVAVMIYLAVARWPIEKPDDIAGGFAPRSSR